MASRANETKLDSETRNFNNVISTMLHVEIFILQTLPSSKPMCLLCNECVSAVKEYDLKRHITTKHGDFEFHTWKVRLLENRRLNHVILKIEEIF